MLKNLDTLNSLEEEISDELKFVLLFNGLFKYWYHAETWNNHQNDDNYMWFSDGLVEGGGYMSKEAFWSDVMDVNYKGVYKNIISIKEPSKIVNNYEFVCCKQNSVRTDFDSMITETVNKCCNFIKWIAEHASNKELPYSYNLIDDKIKDISIYDKAELNKTGSKTLYY